MERHAAVGATSTIALNPADDFYFVCHDRVTGSAQLNTRATELGLAGGLLIAALFDGRITLDTGLVTAVDQRPAAPDDLGGRDEQAAETTVPELIWGQVVAEPWRYPVRTWLTVLGSNAVPTVVDRLAGLGHLTVSGSRRRGRRVAVPTDWKFAEWRAARLRDALTRRHQLRDKDVAVLALLDASGLHDFILDGLEPSAHDYHAYLLAGLQRTHPDVFEVAAHTQAAVAATVMARGHS